MTRIVYRLETRNGPRGGHKVAARHVEALRRNGFDAYVNPSNGGGGASWFEHAAPALTDREIAAGDVLVVGEGSCTLAPETVGAVAEVVIFCQNHFAAAATGFGALAHRRPGQPLRVMACSGTVGRWVARFVPGSAISTVPAFVDGSVFFPRAKDRTIACLPGKRPESFRAIVNMLRTIYRGGEAWNMVTLHDVPEPKVSEALGTASVFLSLSRREGLGLATLEAMSSGCVVAGFTGIGGDEYATPNNGFWAREDDDEACADALSRAMVHVDLFPEVVERMTADASVTAGAYGPPAFEAGLLAFWCRHA